MNIEYKLDQPEDATNPEVNIDGSPFEATQTMKSGNKPETLKIDKECKDNEGN